MDRTFFLDGTKCKSVASIVDVLASLSYDNGLLVLLFLHPQENIVLLAKERTWPTKKSPRPSYT